MILLQRQCLQLAILKLSFGDFGSLLSLQMLVVCSVTLSLQFTLMQLTLSMTERNFFIVFHYIFESLCVGPFQVCRHLHGFWRSQFKLWSYFAPVLEGYKFKENSKPPKIIRCQKTTSLEKQRIFTHFGRV